MKRLLFLTLTLFTLAGSFAHAQSAPPQPKTTAVLVILTIKQGVQRE